MEVTVAFQEVARIVRPFLDDKPFDRDTRVYHHSHRRSVPVVAVFADQKLGGSLGSPFRSGAQFGRSSEKGASLAMQIIRHRIHENVTHLTFERPIVASRSGL